MILNTTQTEKNISPRELQRRLAAGQPAQLLDVRTPGEFSEGYIEGALVSADRAARECVAALSQEEGGE